MKKIIILISMLFIISSCSSVDEEKKVQNINTLDNNIEKTMYNPNLKNSLSKKEAIVKRVGVSEFEKAIHTKKYILIDLRTTPELIESGVLSGNVIQIDFYSPDIQRKLLELDPDEKYLIYCRSGNRSNSVLGFMNDSGFKNVLELEGGIGAWSRAGKKIVVYNK